MAGDRTDSGGAEHRQMVVVDVSGAEELPNEVEGLCHVPNLSNL